LKILALQPGTDAFDEAVRGLVRAERINDVVARQDSKRYQEYLRYTRDAFMGDHPVDPADVYRDRELVPRALDAYALKHDVELTTGLIYIADDFPICAVPDAVDSLIGITVHVRCGSRERSAYDTYREAVERGVSSDMYRHAIAMMAVTRLPYWIHINYLELPEQGIRKLSEHEVEYSKVRGDDLMSALMAFAAKSRFKAAADSEAAA
jgi:hypothetical protein